MRTLCTASLLVLLLAACGLKGPLYLPHEAPPQQAPQSPQTSQPQQSLDEEKRK